MGRSNFQPTLAVTLAASGAAALAMIAALPSAPAMAYEGSGTWSPFSGPGSAGTYAAPVDREYIKQWEANPPKGYPTLSHANIDATKTAIKRYQDIVAKGGWKLVPDAVLQVGSSGPAVGILRERLALSGDLKDDEPGSQSFDNSLEKAVKRFQASNGLTPTGIVDKRTIPALNVSAAARLKQLQQNLNRLSTLARSAGKRYVMVNVPAAQIEAVEGDRVVSRHSGVVGKIDRQTPLLTSQIYELNFNPVWRLPPTVITKDLIPRGREMQSNGKDVLTKFHIDAYDGNGKKLDPEKVNWKSGQPMALTYSQQPGKENPLGFLKINFHNAHSVYMHDTPSDNPFGRNFRAASSGCIRVQGIEDLANWLLADQGGWNSERIAKMKETRERMDVKLKKPVTLHFVYITAWATEDGIVQFRRDLYNKDGVGPTASAY
ncbi:MAG: L,D-transpeptidase family protein [Hyphomicrobium sp.]